MRIIAILFALIAAAPTAAEECGQPFRRGMTSDAVLIICPRPYARKVQNMPTNPDTEKPRGVLGDVPRALSDDQLFRLYMEYLRGNISTEQYRRAAGDWKPPMLSPELQQELAAEPKGPHWADSFGSPSYAPILPRK